MSHGLYFYLLGIHMATRANPVVQETEKDELNIRAMPKLR
jgi:hypothetical protein